MRYLTCLLLTLCLASIFPSTSWTQSIENNQDSQILSENDLRRILIRLYDLGAAKEEIKALTIALEQMQYLMVQERSLASRQIMSERDRTEIANERLALEREKAKVYQEAYEALTRRRGVGCWFKKVFTFGIARCI